MKLYENDNMEIERNELTKLLDDLGIPMVRKEDQQAMLEKLDIARRDLAVLDICFVVLHVFRLRSNNSLIA